MSKQAKWSWMAFVVILLPPAPLFVSGAAAQEQAEEETRLRPLGTSLTAWDILKDKRRAARDGRWSAILVLSEEAGYNGNIFASPTTDGTVNDLPVGSAVLTSSARLEVYRYFTRRNRLTLGGNLVDNRYLEDSDVNGTYVDASAEFEHTFSRSTQAFVSGQVEHENDNAVDIYGDPFTRDFGYVALEGQAGIEQAFGSRHQIELSYEGKQKNYNEVSTLNSLDWIQHGPQVRYRFAAGPTRVRLWYSFAAQHYVEEPASDVNGNELSTNPAEEHFYHRAMLWVSRDLAPHVAADLRVKYNMKDDRFQGYESFHELELSADIAWAMTHKLSAEVRAGLSTADYDYRPAEDAGEALALNYRGGDFTMRYAVSRRAAIFGRYAMMNRNSNRQTGSSYMDYRVNGAGVGVAVVF